jgi:hypothetical protein
MNTIDYSVELRDKTGTFKGFLNPFISQSFTWEWNRIGGCGACRIKLDKKYRQIDFQADDDIQIRLKVGSLTDCVPTMTSNTAPEGIVAASSEASGSEAWRVFDNIIPSDNTHCWQANGATVPQWISYKFPTARVITKYTIRSRTWSSPRTPTAWTFEGSNNGSSWTTLDTQSGQFSGDPQNQLNEYVIPNRTAYLYYRLNISAYNTSAVGVSIGEMELIENYSKLVYRGFLSNLGQTLKVPQENTLEVSGYFNKLSKRIVQENSLEKVYENQEISAIVSSIIDTFIVPNTSITKGTIDTSVFVADELQFKTSVASALETLADLLGNVEYGVDENLVFFWRNESTSLRKKFFVGIDVEMLDRKINWANLANQIYLEGGDVDGVKFTASLGSGTSQSKYFLSEAILSNSSIISSSVSDQYLSSQLKAKSSPEIIIKFKIPNTTLRLEDTLPIGMISVLDTLYDQGTNKWGTSGSGGAGLIWGTKKNGGSGAKWGGTYKQQVTRISYSLSSTTGRMNIEITLGEGITETSARIKYIEHVLNQLRQR